jgi:soluble lytic murein transglycosylase
MNRHLHSLSYVISLAVVAVFATDAVARGSQKHPPAKKAGHEAVARHQRHAETKKNKHAAHTASAKRESSRSSEPLPQSVTASPLSGELAAVKDAIDLARKGKMSDATAAEKTLSDPAARKLVEWFILRHPDADADFRRYAAFIADNPDWPSMPLMRKRAESRLWQERSDAETVHGFTGDRPASAMGKLALARVLLAGGDRDGAAKLVRAVWRADELSERSEADAFETFRDLLTRDDHRARMDKRIGAKDIAGAKRAAQHLGDEELAIVKACAAVNANETKTTDLLDSVAPAARQDLGYTLCRIHAMVRRDRIEDATRLMIAAAPETMAQQETDEWWRERRSLARKLLDQGKPQAAYDVVRAAAPPANEYYRSDFHFMTGWIALRYLNDARRARAHFIHIADGQTNPTVLARAGYWQGRVAEMLGYDSEMRASFKAAARHPTAYYGQLARARLGLDKLELPNAPSLDQAASPALADERVRAADMLYTIGERDLVFRFASDLAEQSTDVAVLSALAELTGRRNDARTMLQIGKPALARGLALVDYAFPTIGIPPHSPIGPAIERSIIYSVARTESAFDQRDKSAANAVGLMQVTPEAGRDTAKRFGVTYDWDRMVSDPVYNTQMGAAELSALLKEYQGCHIMAFAGYNAGRGRVKEWVSKYGDPRDPKVDAVDWVERIPLSETRNYVQRVTENLQVYRVRFDGAASAMSKADPSHTTSQEANAAPPRLAKKSDLP